MNGSQKENYVQYGVTKCDATQPKMHDMQLNKPSLCLNFYIDRSLRELEKSNNEMVSARKNSATHAVSAGFSV